MSERVREVREIVHSNDLDDDASVAREHDGSLMVLMQRITYLVTSVIVMLLGLRLLLSLLGANRGNAFADFVYSMSQPLVAPFFGLFNYTMRYGVSRFEFETLVAMLVYTIIGVIIHQIFSLMREDT